MKRKLKRNSDREGQSQNIRSRPKAQLGREKQGILKIFEFQLIKAMSSVIKRSGKCMCRLPTGRKKRMVDPPYGKKTKL